MSINPRFVNEAGTDLTAGKLHTIRQNFVFWKRFEGRDIELFTWEGKPYQKGSKQKVVCVKRVVSVQEIYMYKNYDASHIDFWSETPFGINKALDNNELWKNDGFRSPESFEDWFVKYPDGEMGIVHFTKFRY
jgi:hypothetical protein